MRNWSIITKIVVSACVIVFVLLLLGSFVLMKFVISPLVEAFTDDYLKKIQQTIDEREQAEKTSLEQNIKFNSEILRRFGGIFLYHFESEELRQALRLYMDHPEILAVKVLDEDGEPFAAAWKTPDITVGNALPDNLELDESLCVQMDYMHDEKKIGSFQVYYTDAILTEKIRAVKKDALAEAETFRNASRSRLNRVIVSQIMGVFLILLVLVFCLIGFFRVVVLKPLSMVSNVTRQLSDLDLTVSMESNKKDEIGLLLTAVNVMVQSFRKVLGQVQRTGGQVSSSATALSAVVKRQGVTIINQVESVDKVVKSAEEISSVATVLVETMQRVASMSQETAEFAGSGQTDLTRMEEVMQNMEDASKAISGRLETINQKAENITSVVTTINKVADQTNLLSLNAAIEAEKAGEYGRGFTIVAREIRRLADQTALATLDIEQMVQGMQSAVSAGVMEMDKFIAEVRHSAEDVGKISTQLTRIIEQVQALLPNFEDVNTVMGRQSENAQEINSAMVNLGEEMQETMESMRESHSAIEQLNEAARSLQNEVSRFKVVG